MRQSAGQAAYGSLTICIYIDGKGQVYLEAFQLDILLVDLLLEVGAMTQTVLKYYDSGSQLLYGLRRWPMAGTLPRC